MKALSIRQPWAFAILHLGKRVENRTWWCGYRGPILLHASKWWNAREVYDDFRTARHMASDEALQAVKASVSEVSLNTLRAQTGGFVGRAQIVGCLKPGERPPRGQQGWYQGEYGILLADVERLPELVPYSGKLGIFEVPEGVVP